MVDLWKESLTQQFICKNHTLTHTQRTQQNTFIDLNNVPAEFCVLLFVLVTLLHCSLSVKWKKYDDGNFPYAIIALLCFRWNKLNPCNYVEVHHFCATSIAKCKFRNNDFQTRFNHCSVIKKDVIRWDQHVAVLVFPNILLS